MDCAAIHLSKRILQKARSLRIWTLLVTAKCTHLFQVLDIHCLFGYKASLSIKGVLPIGSPPSEPAAAPSVTSSLLLRHTLHHILTDALLRWKKAASIDACAGVNAPHDWCIMLPLSQRVQPGVYSPQSISGCADSATLAGEARRLSSLHP